MNKTHQQCNMHLASIADIGECISDGHHVLIMMRGIPGSGKTHLARQLVNHGGANGVICSADDYFITPNGYLFDPSKLDEYHKKNFIRARDAMNMGITPVIVDNTNIQKYHMTRYTNHAASHSYEIYVIEPDNKWKYSPFECERRNVHGLTRERIAMMLDQLMEEGQPTLEYLTGARQIKINSFNSLSTSSSTPSPEKSPKKETKRSIFSLVPETEPPKKEVRNVCTGVTYYLLAKYRSGNDKMLNNEVAMSSVWKKEIGEKKEMKNRPVQTDDVGITGDRRADDIDMLISMFPAVVVDHHMFHANMVSMYDKMGFAETISLMRESGYEADELAGPSGSAKYYLEEIDCQKTHTYEGTRQSKRDRALSNKENDTVSLEKDYENFPRIDGQPVDDETMARELQDMFDKEHAERERPMTKYGLNAGDRLKFERILQMFGSLGESFLLDLFLEYHENETHTIDHIKYHLQVNPQGPSTSTMFSSSPPLSPKKNKTSLEQAQIKAEEIHQEIKMMRMRKDEIEKNLRDMNGHVRGVLHREEINKITDRITSLQNECDAMLKDANGDSTRIDLHYMTIPGAIGYLRGRLEASVGTKLTIITGYGKHSGHAPIKKHVDSIIRNKQFYRCTWENEGMVVVTVIK